MTSAQDVNEQSVPANRPEPIRSEYPVCDPNVFPRYIISFYGGGNMCVSKEEYEAWEGVDKTHRYIQACGFPKCNNRLQHEGKFLPEWRSNVPATFALHETAEVD